MHTEAGTVIDLYRRHAKAWSGQRSTALFEAGWLDAFLSLAGPKPKVLDLGCGSGNPLAAYLIRQGAQVTGIDAAPEMIALARVAYPSAAWQVADMRGLDLGRTFDGLLAWHSSFHLTPRDQRALFAVFQRHAVPGAPLMFTSGPRAGTQMGTLEGAPLYHASLSPEAYQEALDQHGFDLVAHQREDPTCGGATIWLARARGDC